MTEYGVDAGNVKELSAINKKRITKLFKKIKQKKPKDFNSIVLDLHEEAFDQFDCLECANCCKSISPIVKEKDIDRLAKGERCSPSAFIDQYLHMDRDQDFVFNNSPCPFLMDDNYCSRYEHRPKACREYPHTDHSRIDRILPLTIKNREICPIVYIITEELLNYYN